MALPMFLGKRREFCRKSLKYLLFRFDFDKNISFHKRYKMYKSCNILLDNNRSLQLEFGKMAKFADGAVVAKLGDTSVLVAVTSKTDNNPSATFLPLTIDYRQKSAAAGRIPTNHLRRELGPTDKEILTSRVIDRSLRSLFPNNYFNETQITCNLLSVDGVNDPDIVCINAASAALCSSDIPWNGPVGAVRVGTQGEVFIINPTRKQQEQSNINLVIASDREYNVVMLEGEMNNVPFDVFSSAVKIGANNAADVARQIFNATSKNTSKRSYTPPSPVPGPLIEEAKRIGESKINSVLNNKGHNKVSRDKELQNVRHCIIRRLTEMYPSEEYSSLVLHEAVSIVTKKLFRDQIVYGDKRNTNGFKAIGPYPLIGMIHVEKLLEKDRLVLVENPGKLVRCDGRSWHDMRQISCSVDLYKPLHGSALFQRGQTQVLSTVTFDSLQASMKVDPISVLTGALKEKNFMLHYEFPAYATNEVKSPGIKNRRELGHGALAEKGLRAVIPTDFPFSIRLTAEVLESNGSSSMASICGGSLALMDAGVPIKEPAAGVAIGLVKDDKSDKKYHILADLLGIEDYMGDMDMKIGGTKSGITAIQMDLKIPGIPIEVVQQALSLGKIKISQIIKIMSASGIKKPRSSIKSCGPVTERITVSPAKRGQFLGIGGINLKKLQSVAGVTVTTVDESTYEIFAPNADALKEAKEMMSSWMETKRQPNLEFGAVYEGKITEIRDGGVMVQLHPAMEPAYLPNSQLDHRQVSHATALGLQVDQMITVKYFGRDPVTGKVRISRKVLFALPGRTIKFMKEES